MKIFCKISLALIFTVSLTYSLFAQTEREKAIKLYEAGKNKEAIAILEKESKKAKNDAETWNTLGLAYFKDESTKKAIKAFEKAISFNQQNASYRTNLAYAYLQIGKSDAAQAESTKAIAINPKNALAYYLRGVANVYEGDNKEAIDDAERAIGINPNYSLAYVLKSDALLYQFGTQVGGGAKPIDEIELLQQAKEILENCLKNCRNNSQSELQQKRLDTLDVFHKYFSKNRDAMLSAIAEGKLPPVQANQSLPDPSITPMKLLTRPQPRYPSSAREKGIEGTVALAALFSETGKITHALILKGVGGGLNEAALQAAYAIKFEPAKKDGKPFSQIKIITYSFDVY